MTASTLEHPVAATGCGGCGLEHHGLEPKGEVYWNLSPAQIYEESIRRGDGQVAHMGAISAGTAPHTGRSPNDRFVVRDDTTESDVDWGMVNVPISPEHFAALREDIVAHLEARRGIAVGESTPDGRSYLKPEEECRAGCCGAPMRQVDHVYYENLTPERVDEIIDGLE